MPEHDFPMSRLSRRLGPLAAALALGACMPFGGQNLPPAAHQPTAVSLYDGSYEGKIRAIGANAADCPKNGYGVAEIGDAILTLSYRPGVIFTVPVAADGTLHQTIEGARIEGRAVNNHLDLLVSSSTCQTRYRLTYVWNHS